MAGTRLAAAFYRGGTSRGLFFHAADLAPFAQPVRDAVICAAMGSPDPDGRQIDGLGGGISSLSKTAVVSAPAHGLYTEALRQLGADWPLPGVPWADDARRAQDPESGWDVVYRFGQVPVSGPTQIDWGSTCGNLLAAVGTFALQTGVVSPAQVDAYARAHLSPDVDAFRYPVRVLQAAPGKRVTVSVPMVRSPGVAGGPHWQLSSVEDTSIAGVPGRAPGISIHVPLDTPALPTGRPRDEVELDGRRIPVSIVDAGLPVVFVDAKSLGLSDAQFTAHVAELDSDSAMHERAERLRRSAAQLTPELKSVLSPGAPKICMVHPRVAYKSSSGTEVAADAADVLIRAISVGNVHRSVPATTLSALAVCTAYPDSVVGRALARGGARDSPCQTSADAARSGEHLGAITVGHPAGTATAMVQMSQRGDPQAIVYERTARRIMDGYVDVPPRIATSWDSKYAELYERLRSSGHSQ